MSIIKEYRIASRAEFVEVAEKLADYILEHIRQGKTVPVINIHGTVSGGKSIFWDIAIQKILGQTASFIAKKSEVDCGDSSTRLYETWIGRNQETGQDIEVFLCNVRASLNVTKNLDTEALFENRFNKFGSIIMLTNAPNRFFKKDYPVLNIGVTTSHDDVSNEFEGTILYYR